MKCDQEASIEAMRKAVSDSKTGKTMPESSPKGDNQANGRIEEAGKTIWSYVRALKDQIEHNEKGKLRTDNAVLQRFVKWVAMTHARFNIGADGNIA